MTSKDKWNRFIVQQTSSEAPLLSVHLQWKKFISCLLHASVCLSIVAQTHRLVWNAYELPIHHCLPNYALHTQKRKCAPTRLTIMSGPSMALFRKYVYSFVQRCQFSLNFLSDHFKGLMLFAKLTNCSSCRCVVSVLVFLQYCLCVATKTFRMLRGASWFLYCLWFLHLLSPACRRGVQAKYVMLTRSLHFEYHYASVCTLHYDDARMQKLLVRCFNICSSVLTACGMVWFIHACLWLKSRNNTNAAREKQ